MEENPHQVSRTNRTIEGSSKAGVTRNRYLVDDAADLFDCSCKNCGSCTAGFIADCVAVCCCPFAVVNLLALAFVKVPWMIGRRCLGLEKKKGCRLERKERRKRKEKERVIERDSNLRKERVVEGGGIEIPSGFVEGEEKENFCARFEAERVWLELHQVGHLGFGRVSFSGIQGKENLANLRELLDKDY